MMHLPVLLEEVLSNSGLNEGQDAIALDVTFGLGGHSKELLSKFPKLRLFAIDKDDSTRKEASLNFKSYQGRFASGHLCFSELANIDSIFPELESESFDLILADLGYSSAQLDNPERGLSFKTESPLDMRLDQTQKLTAHIVLNEYSERDLFLVFAKGGVGSQSKTLARAIVNDRPIESTKSFHKICNSVLRSKSRKSDSLKYTDYATVPFQAVRIEVNNEFEALKNLLTESISKLKSNGRLLVISFHSLEDKIVTSAMRWWGSVRGKGLHIEDNTLGKLLTKKAIKPSDDELEKNSRSRSAMLRVFERNENKIWLERSLLPQGI